MKLDLRDLLGLAIIDLEVELVAFKKNIGKLKARAFVEGSLACEAIILAAVRDLEDVAGNLHRVP